MLFIQFLITGFVLLVIFRTILSFKRGRISFRSLLLWLGLWLAMSLAVLLPQTTVALARVLGIWRGTDVAVYLSIVLIFYLLFRIFMKLEKIEKDITIVSREIALRNEDKK